MRFFLLILLLAAAPVWAGSLAPKLDIGNGGQCVDDPKFMRKNHMEMIRHQRDETMRLGIRGGKYSLAECVNCHASKKDNSVIGDSEHFCQGCHQYAAVKPDCFECHSSKRKTSLPPLVRGCCRLGGYTTTAYPLRVQEEGWGGDGSDRKPTLTLATPARGAPVGSPLLCSDPSAVSLRERGQTLVAEAGK